MASDEPNEVYRLFCEVTEKYKSELGAELVEALEEGFAEGEEEIVLDSLIYSLRENNCEVDDVTREKLHKIATATGLEDLEVGKGYYW